MGTDGAGGIEWLDDDGRPAAPDEELRGQDRRPPLRRRTKITLAVVAAAVLVAVVTVGVVARPDQAKPKAQRTAVVRQPPLRDNATRHQRLPSSALVAIYAAFPNAELQSYVTVPQTSSASRPTNFYNLSFRGRTITVRVAPLRRTDVDLVSRNKTSVELGQQLGSAFVDIVVTAGTQQPRASDFDAMQTLVQDTRLLAAQ